jgi:formate hydrogenlyase subunit 4
METGIVIGWKICDVNTPSWVCLLLGLILAPLLPGVINKTKAFFGGRKGQPVLQLYYDLRKLLGKGAVYSQTTSWIFRAGPVLWLAGAAAAMLVVPLGSVHAPLDFPGDLILLAYLLGMMRFFLVLTAMDTGSAFEGMGASREVQFSALAEPALLLSLAAIARQTGQLSLTDMYASMSVTTLLRTGPAMILVAGALLIVFLTENARVPVDDPNTHLELTMIHEVMVLDSGGPDLAFVLYGSALKLWILGSLLVGILLPIHTASPWASMAISVGGLLLLAIATGVIESTMARLRLIRVPQLLGAASALAIVALILVFR